jgi:peptide/nickel transport system substrate-binding protein
MQRELGKRYFHLSVTLFCLFLVLSAAAISPAAEAPKKGGTMVVALAADPPSINAGITTDISALNLSGQVYSTVVRVDPDGKAGPYLAKSWTVSPDGKTYTFKFFENIKWHDGKPFTSEDVAFSLLEVNRKFNGMASTAFDMVKAIETPDKYTAVFKLEHPYPPFLRGLGDFGSAVILPKHLFKDTDPLKNPYNFKPVGTGPFVFKEYKKGSHIIFERNPNFHVEGHPYLDRLVFQIIPNAAARGLAIEKGDVDFLPYYTISLAEGTRLGQNPKITVAVPPRMVAGIWIAFLNMRNPPLSKKEVRQALYYALDREELLKKAGFGYGKVSAGPISSELKLFYTDKGRQYPYDPKKAEEMLDASGFPRKEGGVRFALRISYDSQFSPMETAAKLMQIQLKKVGVDVKIMPMDSGAWRDIVFKNWDFDVTMGTFQSGEDPAIGTERLYVCRNVVRLFARNVSGYCNPTLDEIFTKAGQEMNEEKRVGLYHDAIKTLDEDVPAWWLWDRQYPIAYNANLAGLPQDATQYGPYDAVWWKK